MSDAQCFYPNGSPSLEEDIPCGSGDVVACCPLNWICQENGLCYLPDQDYYGRYTCTGHAWDPGCPEICTYDHAAGGNEAVLECETGSYCCDTNRPELSGGVNCCDASTVRFSIDGNSAVNSTSEESLNPSSSQDFSSSTSTINPISEEPSKPSSSEENLTPSPTAVETPDYNTTTYTSSLIIRTICDAAAGETYCGSVCCTTGQYCDTEQCATIGAAEGNPVSVTSNIPSTSPIDPLTGTNAPTQSDMSSEAAAISLTSETKPLIIASTTTATSSIRSSPTITPSLPSLLISTVSTGNVFFTTTITAATTPTRASAEAFIKTRPGKIVVPTVIGGVVLFLILIIGACLCVRRRRNRPKPPPPFGLWTTTNGAPDIGEPANQSFSGPVDPPYPHPYNEPFPFNQPPPGDGRSPMTSQSRFNLSIVPDHDLENRRASTTYLHAPPMNPYVDGRGTSPAPSYRSQDPNLTTRRGQQRRFGRSGSREPGIPEIPGR